MVQNLPPHTSLVYKKIGDQDVNLDIYPPTITSVPAQIDSIMIVPALVYFHGGGLTVGNRTSWFPFWLHSEMMLLVNAQPCADPLLGRAVDLGIAFFSPDYQLLPPGTGHDIISDILDLFSFIGNQDTIFKTRLGETGKEIEYRIDVNAIGLAGSSSGGLCAYLAGGILQPKPKVLLSMYGMGGDFMVWLPTPMTRLQTHGFGIDSLLHRTKV